MADVNLLHRAIRLISLGYLMNRAERKAQAMQLVPGTALPKESAPLPGPCELAEHLVVQGHPELVIPWIDPVTGKAHDCRVHLRDMSSETQLLPSGSSIEPCQRCQSEAEAGGQKFTAI